MPFTASGHTGYSEGENERAFLHRWWMLRDVLVRHADPERRRLLEAGCGNGRVTRGLLEMGFDITAFDYSAQGLRRARADLGRHACRWVQSSAASFQSAEPFDIVLCAGVLVAIADDGEHARSTKNIASLVADGGHLIIEEIMLPLEGMHGRPAPGHAMRFRRPEVYVDLVTPGGLDLVETVRYDNAVLPQRWTIMVFRRPGRSRT